MLPAAIWMLWLFSWVRMSSVVTLRAAALSGSIQMRMA